MTGNCQQENKEENRTERMSGNCKEENRGKNETPPNLFSKSIQF